MAGSRPQFQVFTRAKGHSACAKAAYRAGERIECEQTGNVYDFTRKRGILHSEIMAPDHAPAWARDRVQLWNAVEAGETALNRKWRVAQLAREIMVPIAHELDLETNRAALREWIAEQFVSRGMIADFAIHEPSGKGDDRNHHAHVMLTMREIGPEGWRDKNREWNRTDLLERSIDRWQDIQNRELGRAGHDARCNFSSYASRGIDREPEQHEGPHVTAMKRKGQETRVGNANAARSDRNSARAWQHVEALKEMARVAAERQRFEDWAAERVGQLEAAQNLSRLDQTRALELKAERFETGLQGFYGPHLRTVEAEAGKIRGRLDARGFVATLRRVWSGRADRERLDQITATIADTHQRMQEARAAFANRQNVEKARLGAIQEERRQQQHDGIEKARDRKEQTLSARHAEAQRVLQAQQAKEGAGQATEGKSTAAPQKAPERPPERGQGAVANDRDNRREALLDAAKAIQERPRSKDRSFEP